MVGAILPDGAGRRPDHRPLVVARGRFDQVRIEGLAREHGGQSHRLPGGAGADPHRRRQSRWPWASSSRACSAVGSADAVRAAIDAKRSGRSVLSNTDLMRLVNDLDASNAWAVGRFDALANQADLPDGLHQQDSRRCRGSRPPAT